MVYLSKNYWSDSSQMTVTRFIVKSHIMHTTIRWVYLLPIYIYVRRNFGKSREILSHRSSAFPRGGAIAAATTATAAAVVVGGDVLAGPDAVHITRGTGSRPAVVRLCTRTVVRGFRAAPLFRRVSPTAALPDHREITEHALNILYHR